MMWQRILALVTTAALLAPPVQAGLIFGKKKAAPIDPKQRVPELLGVVKASPDEHKRSQAAEELRKYDPQAFPDLVPVLLDVLINDPKPSVRIEAAQTLGKLRPISQAVGQALEQALARDTSMRVRLQARSSLLQYHWSGYRSPKKDVNPPPQTKEPPLASGLPAAAPASVPPPQETLAPVPSASSAALPTLTRQRGAVPAAGETHPPVIAAQPDAPINDPSVPALRIIPMPGGARPMPAGPPQPPDLTLPPRW
jgi:hypothetical protein